MDLIVADVTNIAAIVGSDVELWGKNLSINEIASSADTISYELLCNIAQRVERLYLKE